MSILPRELWSGSSTTWYEVLKAGLVFLGAIVAAGLARLILSRLAARLDGAGSNALRDVFRAMRLPAQMFMLLGGIYVGLQQVERLRSSVHNAHTFFAAAATLVVVIAASNAASIAIAWHGRRTEQAGGPPGQVGLLRKLAILVIWVLGIVHVLALFDQPIGTLLASLGIASLAVGLALQDTIANLFAGFYIVADRSLRAGDYIKLENGDEGFVETVGWRNTRIRLWANNIVLVPNNKLVQSVITNMTLPNTVLSVYTWCGVSYDSELDRVERIAIETARDTIRRFPGADQTFDPVVRFKEFGDSNITFVVVFRASEVGAQYLLQHEFIKALHRRFREEEVEISYPVRKLVWSEGGPTLRSPGGDR